MIRSQLLNIANEFSSRRGLKQLFLNFADNIYEMDIPTLQCPRDKQPAASTIYGYLVQNGFARQLDAGYRVIDYKDTKNPTREPIGDRDGKVQCEELWENSFIILDELGQKKEAVQEYQALRKLIETQTRRPIPWVFEAPTVGVSPQSQRSLEGSADLIRQKVQGAIDKLNELLTKIKERDEAKYKRCLIACLYWFVLVSEMGQEIPTDLKPFLEGQKINEATIKRIINEFPEYLQNNGGGLGVAYLWPDTQFEATALKTLMGKKGWCTERSKIMYAVLRMAGIPAFFVEPQLSIEYRIEYYLTKGRSEESEKLKRLEDKPILNHMAPGVGVRILNENGKEEVWIVDAALQLIAADYIKKTDRWKAQPYWELSLRHFLMADLSNLGTDQTTEAERLIKKKNFKGASKMLEAAARTFETALHLGVDSTAFHVMGNYTHLLSSKAENLKKLYPPPRDYKKMREELAKGIDRYSKETAAINPNDPVYSLNRGKHLVDKKAWETWEEMITVFLQAMNADPHYVKPYRELGRALHDIRKNTSTLFSTVLEELKKQMIEKIIPNHSKLKEVIREGVKVMQAFGKLSDKEVIDLFEKLNKG